MTDAPQHWSTDRAAPNRKLAYWNDAVCEAMLEMKVDTRERDAFFARLTQRALGPIGLNFVDSSAHEVWRTRRAIAHANSPVFYLLHLRAGGFALEQHGRSCLLRPGDSVLFDSRAPYHFRSSHGLSCLALAVPCSWLAGWLPTAETASAQVFAGQSGWGAALSATLSALAPADPLALPDNLVADQVAALLTLAVGPADATGTTHQQALLRRLRATLGARLHEAGLDPETIAAEHGISKRYLHALFAAAGSSFGADLLALRLDQAKRLLDDPRFRRTEIGEIAWRCGFADASHFARRFRQRFGAAPVLYRRTVHA